MSAAPEADAVAASPPVAADSKVAVDLDLCKACGICINLCPEGVFDADEQALPVVARPGDCTACLLCELHCPDFAIEVRRPVSKSAGKAAATPEDAADAHSDRVIAAVAGRRPGADDDERPVSGSECGVHGGGED
jgi:2-oxoglutarate ferredoxin oxidoreductase subunit delta